jgi:hypothetical protein
MKRLLVAALLAVGMSGAAGAAATAVAGPAVAAETHSNCITFNPDGSVTLVPNCSQTTVTNAPVSQSFSMPNPCDPSSTGSFTMTFTRQVYHITVNGAGDAWDTGTSTGTVSFVPDVSSNPSGAGHLTSWFGDSFNAQNMVQHSTFTVVVHTTDGQTISQHETVHVSLTPNGPAVSFDKPVLSCS